LGIVEKINSKKEILQQIDRKVQDDENRNIRYSMKEDWDKDGGTYNKNINRKDSC
jgi:hypothetical protein